ncbi:MAG: hypothetical protein A2787_00645 [Omnitrophica WOR_2 bacterium RIFCSPHIGHO2_01_FULL_48_9]|nr:MAG: hypothetical protein A3D10_02660 [Omnitrophica WOR_2 bacterium RIFCSPHIGHO2_02_FULL_48_11]OGX33640.1 MAG: hypothetical protein A2787_00645 [Omnitrophica WOR_2 bacterium RIFCSPHIGHO2_01_FULL_48_9]
MSQEPIAPELLKNRDVLEEIARHQWIESEKAGRDVGFDAAAEDWLKRFSKVWMDYHLPEQKSKVSQSAEAVSPKAKSRKAKSYF